MIRSALQSKPKTRKCKVCPETFTVQRMGQKVCSPKCAGEFARIDREKKEADERRESRAADRKRKEEMKTRSDYLKEAQVAFNAWVRERDRQAGRVCVCCGEPLDWSGNNVDAGHYRSTGSAPHMRFVEDNVWAQRKICNRWGAGRAVDYRIGLIARIGIERVEALEADQTPRKYSIADLKEIKATYRAKLKVLLAARAGMGE